MWHKNGRCVPFRNLKCFKLKVVIAHPSASRFTNIIPLNKKIILEERKMRLFSSSLLRFFFSYQAQLTETTINILTSSHDVLL